MSNSVSGAARTTRSDRSSRCYFQITRLVATIVAAKAISANAAQGPLAQVSEECVEGRLNYRLLFGHPPAMRDDRDHAPMVHARRSPRTVRPGRIFARENARDITAGGLCCKRKSYRPRKSCDGSSNPPSATFPLCVLFLRLPQRLREHNAQ